MVMQSVLRSLQILEKVAELQPVRLGELAPAVALPKSTVQRNLETLSEAGWIRSVQGDVTRWEITARVRGLILRSSSDTSIITAAQRPMTALRDATGETVQLKILSGTDDFILVDHVDTRHSVRPVLALGTVLPILASSAGIAVMAHFSDELNGEIVERIRQRPPFDPAFHVRDDTPERVQGAREAGWASQLGWLTDVVGIGSAIVDRSGQPVAGISLIVPLERFDPSKEGEWGAAVAHAAGETGAALGSFRR